MLQLIGGTLRSQPLFDQVDPGSTGDTGVSGNSVLPNDNNPIDTGLGSPNLPVGVGATPSGSPLSNVTSSVTSTVASSLLGGLPLVQIALFILGLICVAGAIYLFKPAQQAGVQPFSPGQVGTGLGKIAYGIKKTIKGGAKAATGAAVAA